MKRFYFISSQPVNSIRLCIRRNHKFQDSNFSTYQRMWSFMESARPSVFTSSNKEGEERVMRGKGSYAYLMESTTIEYVVERNCDLTQVGGMLDSKGYGIAMPPSETVCYCYLLLFIFDKWLLCSRQLSKIVDEYV